MDRLERYFQLMTYGVLAVAGAYIIVGVSSEIIGTAMAAPATYGVPYEVKRMPAIMNKIASCEGITQFDKKGNVVKGKVNSKDIGKWQINETHWGAKAKELGFDIYTAEGNEAMAMWLYHNKGTEVWYLSKKCWK